MTRYQCMKCGRMWKIPSNAWNEEFRCQCGSVVARPCPDGKVVEMRKSKATGQLKPVISKGRRRG